MSLHLSHAAEYRPYVDIPSPIDDYRPRRSLSALSQTETGSSSRGARQLPLPSDDPADAVDMIDEDVASLQYQIEQLQFQKARLLRPTKVDCWRLKGQDSEQKGLKGTPNPY